MKSYNEWMETDFFKQDRNSISSRMSYEGAIENVLKYLVDQGVLGEDGLVYKNILDAQQRL